MKIQLIYFQVVIGLGEGAGANIMLRFGAMHVTRCLGVVCINPNEVAASLLENLMVKFLIFARNNTESFTFYPKLALHCISSIYSEDESKHQLLIYFGIWKIHQKIS